MSSYKLDDRDVRILSILCRDGRLPKAKLADMVHLSSPACWSRLERLERLGIIRGYHAEVALDKLATTIAVFVTVELETHTADTFQRFESEVLKVQKIVACWAVGGGVDYLLQVVAPDIDAYQCLIDELLASRVGISRYFTYIVTKAVKQTHELPLRDLLGSSDLS